MQTSSKIKMALAYKRMSESQLARDIGSSPQAFNQRMKTDKFTAEELEKIAKALNIEAYELFSVPPTPENAMERLHKDIIKEIRQVIVEVLENALADKYKS